MQGPRLVSCRSRAFFCLLKQKLRKLRLPRPRLSFEPTAKCPRARTLFALATQLGGPEPHRDSEQHQLLFGRVNCCIPDGR